MQLSVLTGLRKLRLRGFSMAQDSGVCSGFHVLRAFTCLCLHCGMLLGRLHASVSCTEACE